MKRVLPILLACLLLCAVPLLSGCRKDADDTHEHVEGDWIILKKATCTENGLRCKQCTVCGKELYRETYSEGHTYEDGVCVVCGKAKYDGNYLKYEEITLDGVEGYAVAGMGNCSAKYLEIPAQHNGKPVLSILPGAFADNHKLVTVTLPDTVQAVGASAFAACDFLTSVTVPSGGACREIGEDAFSECPALSAFVFPDGVTAVADRLFAGCAALTQVTLSDATDSFGNDVFDRCDALSLSVRDGIGYVGSEATPCLVAVKVTEQGATAAVLCAGTRFIGSCAFAGQTSLQSLTLPAGIRSVGSFAFAGCTSLTAVNLPQGLIRLERGAFSGCSALRSVTFPDTLERIALPAFNGCPALTEAVFPTGNWVALSGADDAGTPVTVNTPAAGAAVLKGTSGQYLIRK